MSPQSLARTRDKRSLRVPRKFEDFSLVTSGEIPAEVLVASVTAAAATAIASTSQNVSPTPTTTNSTAATTSPTTTSPVNVSASKPASTSTTEPTTTTATISTPTSTTTATTTTTSIPTTTTTSPSMASKLAAPTTTASTAPTSIKSAPPTTTTPPTTLTQTPVSSATSSIPSINKPSSSIKSSGRKKSKGLSLMVKSPTGNGALHNNDGINRTSFGQPQPTKYYNGLPQNMQYGTRLMLNEPIYLPQSVASIAPITTTLQQIANQARRPPFLSKKAEACFAYQEQRKLSNVVSNYMAIIRITKYLELQDVLNLKSLNRTWQSSLNCEAAWERVLIKSTNITNWILFAENILCRYHTSELIFDQFLPSTPTKPIVEVLAKSSIKRLWIKTANEHQNRFAMELICGLNVLDCHIKIKCRLKVVVDDNGLALVPIAIQKDSNVLEAKTSGSKPVPLYYCYQVCPELLNSNNDTILVELSDLEDLFNRCSNQTKEHKVARVDLKPI